MTTTLLPKEQVDVLRSIGDAANVFMALFLIDRLYPGRSTTLRELGNLFGTDKRTIEKRLNSLCGSDRVIFDGHGYVLMEGGRALFLAATPSLPTVSPELQSGAEALEWDTIEALAQSPEPDGQALKAQALILDGVPPMPEMDGDPAQNVHAGQTAHARNARALEEEVRLSLTEVKKDLTSTTYLHTKCAQTLPIEQAFAKTALLFGETVLPREVELWYALAVFAHVYTLKDHSGFRFPARVAWSMMRDSKQPRGDFAARPWDFLPESYMEALGVVRYGCDVCQCPDRFKTRADLKKHIQAKHPLMAFCEDCKKNFLDPAALHAHNAQEHPEPPEPEVLDPDESALAPITGTPRQAAAVNAVRAWQSVVGQLQMEMPRASFESWVRDTQAVRFDGNVLTVAAHNEYARDWLESRLKSTVRRLLIGILARSVDVVFVVEEGRVR